MCAQMLYGSVQFWMNQRDCKIFPASEGFWQALVDIGQCDAWVAWVWANALLHLAWVLMLLICQIYQVSCPSKHIFSTLFLTLTRKLHYFCY